MAKQNIKAEIYSEIIIKKPTKHNHFTMFKTFFASAMLFAVTSTQPTPDQTPFPSSFEDDSAFSPILAAQTDALAETEAQMSDFLAMMKTSANEAQGRKIKWIGVELGVLKEALSRDALRLDTNKELLKWIDKFIKLADVIEKDMKRMLPELQYYDANVQKNTPNFLETGLLDPRRQLINGCSYAT